MTNAKLEHIHIFAHMFSLQLITFKIQRGNWTSNLDQQLLDFNNFYPMCLKFQLKRRLWNLKFFCRIVGITLATLLTQTESQHMLNSAKCQWNTELSTKIIALLPDYLLIYCSVKPFN